VRLPGPYPDEIIGSIFARAAIQTGLPPRRLVATLSKHGRASISFFLPSDIELLTDLTSKPPATLLWKHTVFPYLVAFMHHAKAWRLADQALAASDCRARTLSSLTRMVSNPLPHLRYCEECSDADQKTYGQSYWHRTHQLPGVRVCTAHRTALHESDVLVKTVGRLYECGLPQHQVRVGPLALRPWDYHFAEHSVAALVEREVSASSPHRRYREVAQTKGFLLPSGRTASAPLADDLQRFFGRPRLEELGSNFVSNTQSWPAKIVREGSGVSYATPKHVLMQTFLYSATSRGESTKYRTPGRPKVQLDRIDAGVAQRVQARASEALRLGQRLHVSDLLQELKVWSAFRHDRPSMPLTVAAVQEFKASEACARATGSRGACRASPASDVSYKSIRPPRHLGR
jgi:TniQ/Tn7-like transposition protein D